MRLLIVDDDQHQIQRYADLIEEFNRAGNVEIQPEYRNSLDEAFQALSQNYDGAVIDLRLSGENEAEGNLIIKEIKKNKRFPVCVVTGYPQDLDADLKEDAEGDSNLFFWVEKRDRPFPDVLLRLATIHSSGVVEIIGANGTIETALTTIFWTHLAKTLSFWNAQDETDKHRKQRLLRYTLYHLLSKFEATDDGDFDISYPDEMYVIPPFRTQWQTGDIVKHTETQTYSLILTPACDLAQDKAKRIQVVEIEDFDSGVWSEKKKLYKAVEKRLADQNPEVANGKDELTKTALMDDLMRLMRNSYSLRYHFLPSCQNFPGGMLNFQKVGSIAVKDFSKTYTKEGTVTPAFLKDIVARFATYYARQGQPSFQCERLIIDLLQ